MVLAAHPSCHLNKQIKDESFDVDVLAMYNLFIQISKSVFRICVTDSERSRCLFLQDYSLQNVTNNDELISILEQVYDEHAFLQAGFWKTIKLSIKENNFTLIPNSLFDRNYIKDYLALNCTLNTSIDTGYFYYNQKATDAVNIFSTDKKIADWFQKKYPAKNIQLVHHTSSFIEGALEHSIPDNKQVFLQIESEFVTIVVSNNKKLEYCNNFHFSSSEDFIYYVLFVFDQLQLSQEQTPIMIWGEITPDSVLFSKLKKYVRNVSFGEKPSGIKFGYWFDEVFDHRFFDLYAMHLCE